MTKPSQPTALTEAEHITLEDYIRAAGAKAHPPLTDDEVRALGWNPTPQGWVRIPADSDATPPRAPAADVSIPAGIQGSLDPYRDPEPVYELGPVTPESAALSRQRDDAEPEPRSDQPTDHAAGESQGDSRNPDTAHPRSSTRQRPQRAPRPPRPPRA